MPLRALGYITSALRVQTALPEAQVQMVHTVNTAHRVNGLNPRGPTEQAKQLADLSRLAIERAYGVTHLIDPVSTPMINEEAVARTLTRLPEHAQQKLARGGAGKGSAPSYVAAHLLMHDTRIELEPLGPDEADPIVPKHIISIGAQSERPFYLARMACREDVELPDPVEHTGQLFTKHVLPPYYKCREGEPGISDIMSGHDPLRETYYILDVSQQQNPSVQRDLAYLAHFLRTQDQQTVSTTETITNLKHA